MQRDTHEYFQIKESEYNTELVLGKGDNALSIKMEYYPKTKKTKTIFTMNSKKQKHGEFKSFHENGRTHIICSYINGSLDGKYFEWTSNGRLIKHRVYQDDEVIGIL